MQKDTPHIESHLPSVAGLNLFIGLKHILYSLKKQFVVKNCRFISYSLCLYSYNCNNYYIHSNYQQVVRQVVTFQLVLKMGYINEKRNIYN